MKRYLLDTSLLAAYLHNRTKAIRLMTPWIKNDEAVTSILVYGEVIEYLKGLPNFADKYAKLQGILNEIPAYPLVFDSHIRCHLPENVNHISLPEHKKLLTIIGSQWAYFCLSVNQKWLPLEHFCC